MGLGDVVSKLLGKDPGVQIKVYECRACESTFNSAKSPDRASCPECLSNDVVRVGTTDSYS